MENFPIYVRLIEHLQRRLLSLFGYPIPCHYVQRPGPYDLITGYLLIDYIEETAGKMLSATWEELRHDKSRRINLFTDLSRIILSLGRIPLPRIGSFTIDDDGVVKLTNRPLTLPLQFWENEGIPTNINRSLTYSSVDPYLLDLLACHDNRLHHQPNSVTDEIDCRAQMAILTTMRSVLPRYLCRDLRYGPFFMTLTDLHSSNIFVDKDWHIKYLVDLEWACSLPGDMQHPPWWLTSRGVD